MAHIQELIYEKLSVSLDSLTNCEKERNIVPLLLYVFGGAGKKSIHTALILKYTNLIPSDKSGERSMNNNNTLIVFQKGGERIVGEIKS